MPQTANKELLVGQVTNECGKLGVSGMGAHLEKICINFHHPLQAVLQLARTVANCS